MGKVQKLKIKPYARLLTMLGEQLIKNERIALIELIKNSYDADAEWVKVSFENFGENYEISKESKIVIEDSGKGMTLDIVEKHWLNPATPEKKNRKKKKNSTKKGRIIQGEKGIGRFAILKLGRKIDVITRAEHENEEHVVQYDFTSYDDEFLSVNGEEAELFLDDLEVNVVSRNPSRIIEGTIILGIKKRKKFSHGTIIEISNLKGKWNENKVRSIYNDLAKLQSIFSSSTSNDFEVLIYKDDILQNFHEDYLEKLKFLMEERAVFRITDGKFDVENLEYSFLLNDIPQKVSLLSSDIKGLSVFRKRFGNNATVLNDRKIDCGSFNFGFYIFDFSAQVPPKYQLDKEDKNIIEDHRIYLYRDGIRVYPYGEPDDDWLRIDVYRGTISAGHFLSNKQVVGFINISQEHNPKLKDKTNREGLIDEDNATDDFVVIIQSLLAYIRQKPYARYRNEIERKEEQDKRKSVNLDEKFEKLKEVVSDNKQAVDLIVNAEKEYKAEKRFLTRRVEITEDLAGVGLSVETASHDIMGIMGKVFSNLDGLINDLLAGGAVDEEELLKELQTIRGGISFMEAQLKDIQLLFRSSKQRRKQIRLSEIIRKVERIYSRLLKKESIEFTINTIGSPLVVKTTDAVLLQLLLNLFDNAVYWLNQTSRNDKRIEILLDGSNNTMIFSDNGPGINREDEPYIFEPFYSGKGDEGRGLGLYIARQLLERSDYTIELADTQSEKLQQGANFVIDFNTEEA